MCFSICLIFLALSSFRVTCAQDLVVYTVATEKNDALTRFERSAELGGFEIKVLGEGVQWIGGDVAKSAGGGQKINLLKEALKPHSDNEDLLVMFVDSYDVVFADTKAELLRKYKAMDAKVVFAAEGFCWPQKDLEQSYPEVDKDDKRFLNSGGFIGPASVIYDIVTLNSVKDADDDQLYYTKVFLDNPQRAKFGIVLDTKSSIFQTLNGALDEVSIRYRKNTGYVYNTKTKTTPVVVHGNGPIKDKLNSLSNYLAHSWTPTEGCQQCKENNINLAKLYESEYPIVQLSIFIEVPTPFLDRFFERVAQLTYPKSRTHVTLHFSPTTSFQRKLGEAFNRTYGGEYQGISWLEGASDASGLNEAFTRCLSMEDCQFLFMLNGVVQLAMPDTIEHLVTMNRSMLAPLLARRGKLWSNFWGALGKDGFYARSDDYVDILEGTKIGIWNVPFIRDAIMISRSAIRLLVNTVADVPEDVDMFLAASAREKNIFMMVDNQKSFGYLINPDTYSTDHVNNDLWQIFDNPLDWEEKYIHQNYSTFADPEVHMSEIAQPCPDVFWFPLVTDKFCDDMVEDTENYGVWSDGSNKDPRLEGGYENVPTRDIHMRQVNFEEHWIHFLRKYIHPMQVKLFQGYEDKPWARMNFVVRYRPDEQPSLRPHHDASSYTLNIALNHAGIDYKGGGVNFLRYNCTLLDTRKGWTLIHPGRVTHLHEGLLTTEGTRYIFITFVSP